MTEAYAIAPAASRGGDGSKPTMQQVLHLLIVDRDRGSALAAWFGTRWLLPVLTCHERARAGAMAVRWAVEHGMACEVAGQWLGRVETAGTDWLLIMRATTCSSPDASLKWTPLESLLSAMSLIEYQGWAVRRSLECDSLPSLPGPFGNLTWVDDVKAWIGGSSGACCRALTPYRVTPYEVVLGADTRCGRVYLKGLTDERADEAGLTKTLALIAPNSFARTLAIERRPGDSVWWSTAECPGRPAENPAVVAWALARVQRRVMASGPVRRELDDLNIDAAVQWACDFVDDASCAKTIREHAHVVVTANVPESWIPMDLDPTNVLVDESGEVRFIDLDESYFGPAPLAMATFANRCRNTSIYRVYQQAWSPPLTDVHWRAFEVVAAVLEAWRGWQRVERNTRRGEVHGALDLAARRIRERLARVSHRR